MREPTLIECEYLYRLTRHIIKTVPSIKVDGVDWVLHEEPMVGTIYLVGGRLDVYATPGWESEWLPMQIWDEDQQDYRKSKDYGSPDMFTGDFEADTLTWRLEVQKFIMNSGSTS